jgi:hypothetical protein
MKKHVSHCFTIKKKGFTNLTMSKSIGSPFSDPNLSGLANSHRFTTSETSAEKTRNLTG